MVPPLFSMTPKCPKPAVVRNSAHQDDCMNPVSGVAASRRSHACQRSGAAGEDDMQAASPCSKLHALKRGTTRRPGCPGRLVTAPSAAAPAATAAAVRPRATTAATNRRQRDRRKPGREALLQLFDFEVQMLHDATSC